MSAPVELDDRARALQQIVALARAHELTVIDISGALAGEAASDLSRRSREAAKAHPSAVARRADAEGRTRAILVRVGAYLGGTFIFAGIAAFIALQWDSMNSAARVIITLGSGTAAFVLATIATRDVRFEKGAPPLFLIAAVLEPIGMLVAFNEFGSGGDARWAALFTAGVMAIQFAVVFSVLRQSMLLFLAVFFAMLAWVTVFDILDIDESAGAMALGGCLLLAAIAADRTPHTSITPAWYLVGGIAFLYGLFDLVAETPFELLFILMASGFVYLSAAISSRTLLLVATGAILGYTGWFTGEHFADSLGWPLALMLFGLLMISLSALAFRIDRQYIRSR
jgi:hypothetical protein